MRHPCLFLHFVAGTAIYNKTAMGDLTALYLFVYDVQPIGQGKLLVVGHCLKDKSRMNSSCDNNKGSR